jgi:drug/metabolite transporter (DMT)-like permease
VSRRSIVDVGLLLLVNAVWGAQFTAYKLVSGELGPLTVSAWIFLIATLVLAPFAAIDYAQSRRAKKLLGNPGQALSLRDLTGFFVIGVLGLVPASALMAWGVARSTASNSALINLTVPVITALLASAILAEKMTQLRWASLIVSVAGVLILSDLDWRHLELASSRFLFGNVLVLLSCTSSSLYNVCSKDLLRRFSPIQVLVTGYAVAVLISIPLALATENISLAGMISYSRDTWIGLGLLAVFVWGLAMVLWMFLLSRLDVSQASVSVYLLPFFGVIISAIFLNEKLTGTMIFGGLITLAGTVLIVALDGKG